MSFPRYQAYKPSGVEWLGEVPEHWGILPVKRLASLQSGTGITSDSISEDATYPVFGGNGVRGFSDSFTHEGYYPIIGRQGALCGNINYATGRFWASEHAVVVSPARHCEVRWLGETLRAMNLNQYSTSAAQPGLSVEMINTLMMPCPPQKEQAAIATFLVRETAKIDALIAEQQRLIELLQEKRQAVVSHAVTKGLNPDAPMKDSGVEWLGEVPEHWAVKQLKYLVTLASGGTPSKENLAYWDGAIPWASSKDLKADELFDTQDHISQKAIDDGVATLMPAGSILTVVRGMILRHTFPVAITRVPMAINQDLKVIRPSGQVASGYLAWLLRGSSGEVLSRVDEAGHGTKVLRIDWWLTMMVPVPPVAEQKHIAESLIKHLQEIVALTDEAHRAVSLLQERRSVLISAAVTGQIDVRGLVPEAYAT